LAEELTIERLRKLYDAMPCRPFVIRLADDREVPVHHRDFIIPVPSGRAIFVEQPDDTVNIIDLLLLTDVELRPGRYGTQRRRRTG